jgi:hypothetical protein
MGKLEFEIDKLSKENNEELNLFDFKLLHQLSKYTLKPSKKNIDKKKELKDNIDKEKELKKLISKILNEDNTIIKKIEDDGNEIENNEIDLNNIIKIMLETSLSYTLKNDQVIANKWIKYFSKSSENYSFNPLIYLKNFQYEGVNASGTFIPLLQTYYESDAKKISESTKTTPLAITYKDMKEKVRVSYMNINGNFNYFDPDIEERFKIWKLFSFNFMLTSLNYQFFST